MSDKIKQWSEEVSRLGGELEHLRDNGDLGTSDGNAKFDELFDSRQALLAKIEGEKRALKLAVDTDAAKEQDEKIVRSNQYKSATSYQPTARDYDNAFRAWAISKNKDLWDQHKSNPFVRECFASAKACGQDPLANTLTVRGTGNQTVGTTTAGGFLAQNEFLRTFSEMLLNKGGLRKVDTVLTTITNQPLPIPVNDDTANNGLGIGSEGTASTVQDTAFAERKILSFKYSSGIVKCSHELILDSVFDIRSFVTGILGKRLVRATEADYASGADDTSQPRGCLTMAAIGKTAASASTITYQEVVDWIMSVDSDYRANGSIVASDSFLALMMKLVSDNGTPLWNPALLADGGFDRIMGYKVVPNNSYPSVATDNLVASFGDHSQYYIRDTNTVRLLMSDQAYWANDILAFVALLHTGGDLIRSSGTSPVKTFKMG